MLEDVVPGEDFNPKTTCCFRMCCCFYYLFCCCIICERSKRVTKQTFVKRFEKWLNLEKSIQAKHLKVAKTMMRVYAHQSGAIKDLEKCRINPDLNSPFRDDLEFFIPQLCSFYLKGGIERPEDLFQVMIRAAQNDFFFSHRIWFFFHSAMFQEFSQQIYESSFQILHGLKMVCLEQKTERLYIANSTTIARAIFQLFMSDFYPSLHSDQQLQALLRHA
jgi:hypothetical protein